MKKTYRMEFTQKEKKKPNFIKRLLGNENSEEKGTKSVYRQKEDSKFGRTLNQSSSRAMAKPRRIKEKKIQESIYDEIDLGSDDIKSIEEFHRSEINDENSAIDESSIKINSRFKIEKVEDDAYAMLDVGEFKKTPSAAGSLGKMSNVDFNNLEVSSKAQDSKGSISTTEQKITPKVNFEQIFDSSSETKKELENINRRKSMGRSKSIAVVEETKRRALIDVFKKMDDANLGMNSEKPLELNVDKLKENSFEYDYNENMESQNIDLKDLLIIQEKNRAHHEATESINAPVAVSIIYGLIICLGGMFVSFDSLAGNLGKYRFVSVGYYVIIYTIGIFSIIFVFFDYKKFIETLTESKTCKLDRTKNNKESVYATMNTKNGVNEIYASRSESEFDPQNPKRYLDENFSGYLVDQNVPFNMYLKIGLGIFCMITLLQCFIGMSEAIENFINGVNDCLVETSEGIVSFFHFLFTCLQLIFIFLRGNIVICRNSYWSHLFTMHLAMTNLIVWFKNILLETLDEYYEHILHEEFGSYSNNSYINNSTTNFYVNNGSNLTTSNLNLDCHDPKKALIKKFVLKLKPYLYPGTIEFSVTCATIFLIMWYKTDKRTAKCLSLPPAKKNFEDVGIVNVPFTNLLTIVDCTKTFKGIIFGILAFVVTIMSTILFFIYMDKLPKISKLVTEITEISLLSIALAVTIYSYRLITKNYKKENLPVNMFDVVLEVFSLGGIIAYSVNNLIAIFYSYVDNQKVAVYRAGGGEEDLTKNITSAFAAVLQLIQGCVQTLFIMECLKRYASKDSAFLRKPGRSLITFLLILNVSMWIFDTFSAKRFNVKNYLIDYFGILKWSIINAFSAPIAIFYRFHSSVCLSDIWISLYYGEYEEHMEDNKSV